MRALSPQLEPVSTVGAGDVLLAQWLAATLDGKPADDALRLSVAAGAASVLVAGAGCFEPKEAGRLVSLVELAELAAT